MPNNNDFIAKAKSQGYTDEQIRQYQSLKQSGQLPVKMPVVNTVSQVDTDAALHSQGMLQDFVGSGWNAAVDMVKAVPMIAKAVNDTTADNDTFSNAMKVTSDAIDKHLKYTIAPDYNKGIVELNEDGSMSLTNLRSLSNGVGNGLGQVGLAMATGGGSAWRRLAANTLMNFPSVYESAEKAGLNKKDAARFSLLLAPILGATEEIGGVQPYLAKNLFGKVAAVETKQIISKLRNETIIETLQKAAKGELGELSEQEFGRLAKETSVSYLNKLKQLAPEAVKGALPEMSQEMFQDALQQGAEQIYDKLYAGNSNVGEGKFGTEFITDDPNKQFGGISIGGYGITKKAVVSQVNNGVLGGILGAGSHIAIHQNPEALQQTLFGFIDDNVRNEKGEDAMKRINALVNINVQQQKITPQDGEIMLKKAQQIYDVADRWKGVEHEGMSNTDRYKAYDLTSNVLPMLDGPIKQFETTFQANDLPTALQNIDTNEKIDDFQKGAMKKSAVETFGNYWKATQKRDVIKSYLQQLGTSGKATDLNAQIKAIDSLSMNEIFNKIGMESVAPKNAATKAIYDQLNIENDGEGIQEQSANEEMLPTEQQGLGLQTSDEGNQELSQVAQQGKTEEVNGSFNFNLPTLESNITADEKQLSNESADIDSGIIEGAEGEEEAAILHSIGLSLESQSGIGQEQGNGTDKASQSTGERENNGQNDGANNETSSKSSANTNTSESEANVQRYQDGSNKPNTKNLNQDKDGKVQNDGRTSEESGQVNTETTASEGQTSGVGKKQRKRAKGTPKSRRSINDPNYKKALSHEIESAEDLALKAFIGGAKIQYSVIDKMYRNAKGEAQKRISFLSKDGFPTIDAMAHSLWEDGQIEEFGYQKFSAEVISNAIEDVLNSHYGTRSMVDDINSRFDIEKKNPEEDENYIAYLKEEQEKDKERGYTQTQIDDAYAALYGMTEQEIEDFFNDRDDAVLQMHLDSLDEMVSPEEVIQERIDSAQNALDEAEAILSKAESDYNKKKENFEKNLSENQTDMFGQNKTPSMFDDKAQQQEILNQAKNKVDSAREAVSKAKEKLQLEIDKVGQSEIEFNEKPTTETTSTTSNVGVVAGSVGVGGDVEIKNEGKAKAPTKESVTERLNINNPFYRKVEDALVKLGLIEKYNPETGTGDVVGGYAQQTSDGGFSVGKMLFSQDGSISYFDGDVKVSFDKNGNVISENTKEAKQKAVSLETESKKESIANLEKTRDSEAFKYKEVTETDVLGNKKKVKRLKTPQELKESTDKINATIDKAKSALSELEQSLKETPTETEVVGVGGDENAWGSDKGLTENFYTTDVDGYAIKKPITNPSSVTIDGVDFHIAKVDGDWKVIEKKSGLEISTGKISNTKNAAIEDATIRLAQNGGAKNLPTLIDRAIQGFKDRNTKAVEQSLKETTKAEKSSIEKIDDEIANLWDDLASSIGAIKKFDGNGGPDPKALEIGIKLVSLYTKKGIYQLSDMAKDMAERFGEAAKDLLPYLKDAYNSVRGRSDREDRKKFNTEDEVFDFELKNEQDGTNDTGTVRQPIEQSSKGNGRNSGNVDRAPKGKQEDLFSSTTESGGTEKQGNTETERISSGRGTVQNNGSSGGRGRGISEGRTLFVADDKPENFTLPDNFGIKTFNPKVRFSENLDALKIVVALKNENRAATKEEQDKLSRYVGWGGLGVVLANQNTVWTQSDEQLRPLVVELDGVISELEKAGFKDVKKHIKASVSTSHYTPIPVIKSMYSALTQLGFKHGNILDPSAGIGHFFGAMPTSIKNNSSLTSVEIEPLTAFIHKSLYPNATGYNTGYEDANLPDGNYDLVVSNVPFGQLAVYDKKFNTPELKSIQGKIHNYFFAKAIQQAKEGGLIAFITSSGTLNSRENENIRKYISKNAEFIGAIRLPSSTFQGNAGTQVVSDVIFLKKNSKGNAGGIDFNTIVEIEVPHKSTGEETKIDVNKYFVDNPGNVIGEFKAGGQYRADEMTVIQKDGTDIAAEMQKAIENTFPKNIYSKVDAFSQKNTLVEIQESKDIHENELYIGKDGMPYKSNGEGKEPTSIAKKYTPKLVAQFIALRDTLKRQYELESDTRASENDIENNRHFLNKYYEGFVSKFGNLHKSSGLILKDVNGFNVLSLETKDDNSKTYRKADILSRRVIKVVTRPTSAENINDAINISLDESGFIDENRVASLLGQSVENVISSHYGELFYDSDGKIVDRATYLSGNVKKKLAEAIELSKTNALYEKNVEELEKVQPEDIPASSIDVNIGARWVPVETYKKFVSEILNSNVDIIYSKAKDEYTVSGNETVESKEKYGTSRISAYRLIELAMAGQSPVIRDKVSSDPDKYVVNKDETQKAQEKQEEVIEMFGDWIWKDSSRRDSLGALYNAKFNTTVKKKYNGSYLHFDGMNDEIKLAQHQLDGASMLIANKGGIIDHIVGAGKTYLMIAAAVKMKRMGIINKPVIAGLKSTIPHLISYAKKLYPGAKILSPSQTDFNAKNRKAFLSKIQNNDWDLIIMSHEQFGSIPQDTEMQIDVMNEEIEMLDMEIALLEAESGKSASKKVLKGLEARKNTLVSKLKELMDAPKDIEILNFKQIGIDKIFIDESQMFKNLEYSTRINRVAGLGNPKGSKRALNLLTAIRTLQKHHGGDMGTTFLSGTPISNSLVEMYLLFKYLRPNKMNELGYKTFDSWVKQFAVASNAIEFAVTGSVKQNTRFRSFINIPELSMLYSEITDLRNDDNLVLPKPKIKGGEPKLVLIKQSEYQKEWTQRLIEFAKQTHGDRDGSLIGKGELTESEQTAAMLMVTGISNKLSIDMRLIDKSAEDNPTGKLSAVAQKVYEDYVETEAIKGTQLIFCDTGTPKTKNTVENLKGYMEDELNIQLDDINSVFGEEGAPLPPIATVKERLATALEWEPEYIESVINESKNAEGQFNVYDELKRKLVEKGVPENQVVFIHSYNTAKAKEALFDAVNNGDIRVVIGSTQKLGTGVNCQRRIVSLHHIDAQWNPAAMEQRNGRGIRQKNMNAEVGIYYYGTELTLDAYKYQLIATKQKFINQVKSGTLSEGERSVREDDGEDMGMDSMVAVLSGNPLLFEKAKTDNIVDKMKRSRKNFYAEIYNAESKIDSITANIPNIEAEIEKRKADLDKAKSFGYNEEGTRIKTVAEIVGGKPYETTKELGEQIISQKNQILQRPVGHTQIIGTVNGMKLQGTLVKSMDASGLFQNSLSVELKLVGELSYSVTSSADPTSQGVALSNTLNKLEDGLRSKSESLNISKVNLIKYKELSKKTWDKQSEYDALIEKQKKINDELKAQEKAENGAKEDNEEEMFATGPQTESTETQKQQSQTIIDFFQRGLKLDVFAPASEYATALAEATKGKALLSDKGQPIGFVKNGKIYLDPNTITPETTFHELIHIQQQLIKEAAKKGDAQAEMILKRFNVLLGDTVSKIMNGNRNVLIDGVKVDLSSSVYDRVDGETDLQYRERLRDELWAYIQALVNEKKWNEGTSGIVSRFIEAVKKFFKEKLGLKNADNIQSMTLGELIDASANSLIKGEFMENVDNVYKGVETPMVADKNKVYRVVSTADTAVGKDVSYSNSLNWYEGQGFIIEANKANGENIVHHSGSKRGEISKNDVTTVYYEPNGFATDSETVYSELDKMRKLFPSASFVQIKYNETEAGKADLNTVGKESLTKSGQPLFAIAQTTTPLIDEIKQTPELNISKETIPTMSFPIAINMLKNKIGSGIKKLGNNVTPSVAVSDYLTDYINKILEWKATNADGTEKRYAFVGKLEDIRSSLGKASTVPLLNNIYDHIVSNKPLTKESSALLNALTEYFIQYVRVKETNDAIVIDAENIYNRDEVKAIAEKELTAGKEAMRVKLLENSKYGKYIANALEKYTLAVSSLPTWAKILAGGENSMLYKLVKALDSAQDKQYVMAETAKSFLSQIQDKIATGSTFNTNDITKSAKEEVGKYFEKYSGIKTKISEGELLHVYLTLKNDQVRARFFKNGDSGVFELKEYRDKNDKVLREHLSIDMTEADYNNLESKFSTPEWSSKIKAWTDANEYLYKYVDQTHREDTGVSLRKAEGFYYPLIHGTGISSYEDYLKQNKFVDDLRSAKARSPQVHANYLVVDALQLMNNYVDANTKYASYATPLKNIDVYLKDSDEFFRKNDMMKYVDWYNKFKKEFEDPSPDKMGEIEKRILSGFVISRLGLNPFVTLKQYSSIFVSNNVIPSKYIVSSLDELAKNAGGVIKSFIPGKTIPFDKTMNEMLEHSATARRRLNAGQNYFDQMVKSSIKDFETVVMGKNIKIPFSKMTNNIMAADRAVSALYWVAAKKQVSAEMNAPVGSTEYWNAVNDIYTKAVIESQSSMDDVNRPHVTKDAGILVKGLTLFSGQSFSNFNSFMGSVIEHANNPSKDNKMKVARSIMNIYVYNALMVAAVDSLKYAQNGDDEDKLKKKAFRSLISNSYQNIPLIAPIVDEVWSKVENPRFARDINYPVLQVINDGASVLGNLSNEKFDKAITEGIKFGGEAIGMPAYPMETFQKIYAKK